MKTKHRVQERRIESIVKSLELIENQNALNSQNLANVMEENLELRLPDFLKVCSMSLKNSAFSLSLEYSTYRIRHDQKQLNAPCHEEGFQGTGVKQDQVGPMSAVH